MQLGMKNKGVDFTKALDFTSDASKEVVKYYADGIRDGYFRTAGSDKYLSGPFQNKKWLCMLVQQRVNHS